MLKHEKLNAFPPKVVSDAKISTVILTTAI